MQMTGNLVELDSTDPDLTWVTFGGVRCGTPVVPGIVVGVGARFRH
jgi:hypothetical protein